MTAPRRLGRSDIKRLLEENGLSPRKSLGQNFVVDPNITERIVRLAAIGPDDHVIEIGPGLGSLTVALEATGAAIVAVEIDAGLAAVLRNTLGPTVTVIEHDALTADIGSELLRAAPGTDGNGVPWVLVANLPYNVATPLVMQILESVPAITRMIVMVQKEVADRFVSGPSTKAYGAVSVRIAYFATARIVAKVPREVFLPQPHIDSALVEIVRSDAPAIRPDQCSYEEFSVLVRQGFAQRRKMLRSSLSGLVSEEAFIAADLLPTLRAENLGVAEWGKLAECQRAISNSPTPS